MRMISLSISSDTNKTAKNTYIFVLYTKFKQKFHEILTRSMNLRDCVASFSTHNTFNVYNFVSSYWHIFYYYYYLLFFLFCQSLWSGRHHFVSIFRFVLFRCLILLILHYCDWQQENMSKWVCLQKHIKHYVFRRIFTIHF